MRIVGLILFVAVGNCTAQVRDYSRPAFSDQDSLADVEVSDTAVGDTLASDNTPNVERLFSQSCQQADVQQAIDVGLNTFGEGEFTVVVAAGDCDWGDTGISVVATIHLEGAGRNATILRRTGIVTTPLIQIDCQTTNGARFSGMTLSGLGDAATLDHGLALNYGCRDFLIFDARFEKFGGWGVEISNNTSGKPVSRGVIYHSEFIDNFKVGYGYGVVITGDGGWPPFVWGSQEAVFVEDNYFQGNRHAIASNFGSLYVFRHNNVTDNHPNYIAVDAHGQSLPPGHGSRGWEIYGNTLTQTLGNTGYTAIGMRGGEGVIFDNVLVNYNYPINLLVENSSQCQNMSYPSLDQPSQVFIWNNTPNTVATGAPEDCSNLLVLDRDYFLQEPPSYVPYPYPHPGRL